MPEEQQYQACRELAIWPLRLLLPRLSPVKVQVELQDATKGTVDKISLGGVKLFPLYRLEHAKAAIVRHTCETAKRKVLYKNEHPLEQCLSTFNARNFGKSRDNAAGNDSAFSLAYVCENTRRQRDAFERSDIVAQPNDNELWIDLQQTNLLVVLQELDEGRGKIVVRVWLHHSRTTQGSKSKHNHGSYTLGEHSEEHRRLCEAGSSAGGSIAGSGAGSGSGDGSGSEAASGSGLGGSPRLEGLSGCPEECSACMNHADIAQHTGENA